MHAYSWRRKVQLREHGAVLCNGGAYRGIELGERKFPPRLFVLVFAVVIFVIGQAALLSGYERGLVYHLAQSLR